MDGKSVALQTPLLFIKWNPMENEIIFNSRFRFIDWHRRLDNDVKHNGPRWAKQEIIGGHMPWIEYAADGKRGIDAHSKRFM